jgi:hypothetical protein
MLQQRARKFLQIGLARTFRARRLSLNTCPAHFPLIRDDGHCSGIAVLLVIGVPVLCRRYVTDMQMR